MSLAFNPLDIPAIFFEPERMLLSRPESEHLPFIACAISLLAPRLILELGIGNGDSYAAICQTAKEQGLQANCYGIADSQEAQDLAAIAELRRLQKQQAYYRVHSKIIEIASREVMAEPEILSQRPGRMVNLNEALGHFSQGSIDLLHLNQLPAGRSAAQVLSDWRDKLSPRAVVLIQGQSTRIDHSGPQFQFEHGNGLTVWALGHEVPLEFQEFLARAMAEPEKMRRFFERCGRQLVQRSEAARGLEVLRAENSRIRTASVVQAQTIELLNEQLTARTIELEQLTSSLLWRLKTRLLPVYMQLPYALRLVIARSVRWLLARGKSLAKFSTQLTESRHSVSPVKSVSVSSTSKALTPINTQKCDELVAALLAEQAAHRSVVNRTALPKIDVIVPVYGGVEETLQCLASVLRSCPAVPYELVVIDDVGPEPLLRKYLEDLAAQGLFTLLHNAENLGFVKTVNRGMQLHPERDVVLLNSDTQVAADWLDRLTRAAVAYPDIGTVTPLSNNATICSYPVAFEVNEIPQDADFAQLDQLCAEVNTGQAVDIPTAVGFCMYIRRCCLNEVGYFDEEKFGRGYGEENDFCMRALAKGWRHVLATDIFVYHAGNISFGEEHSPIKQRAAVIIDKLYPAYSGLVQRHIAANPAKTARRRLDLARLTGAGPAILFINHNMGGGSARHVQELVAGLKRDGMRSVVLQPAGLNQVQLIHPDIAPLPNLIFDVRSECSDLLAALKALAICHAHIHHTIGLPKETLLVVRALGVTYDWTIHDFYTICPRLNLLDGSGRYCGEPGPQICDQCIRKNGTFIGAFSPPEVTIEPWRAAHAEWLAGARKVFVPHHSVAARLQPYFPQVVFEERRHMESYPQAKSLALQRSEGEPLRVAVLGVIVPHKGSELLLACAKDAEARRLPLSFHLIGQVHQPSRFDNFKNITMTGEYKEEDVFALLETQRCHCVFFASIIPETYSFTLSIALAAGLFPVAYDLGAIGARIRETGWGHLFPLSTSAAEINNYLVSLSPVLPDVHLKVEPPKTIYTDMLHDYYQLTVNGENINFANFEISNEAGGN